MLDAAVHYRRVAEERGGELAEAWPSGSFALATLHRAENTDDTERLGTILGALNRIARDVCPVLLPLHPRARKAIASAGFKLDAIHILKPVSYLEMLLLESRARLILTDSGGVQKEAYFAGVPCITLRDETEWVETLDNGCNVLTGADEAAIVHAASNGRSVGPWRDLYGDGHATTAVVKMLLDGAPALSGL